MQQAQGLKKHFINQIQTQNTQKVSTKLALLPIYNLWSQFFF